MKLSTILAASAFALASTAALAGDAAPRGKNASAPSAAQGPQPARAGVSGFGTAVAVDALDKHRGGAEVHVSEMQVRGTLGGNAAYNLETGSNFITTGAFSNTAGMPMTIQNSGNNVLIQSSTIINVESR